MLEHAADLGLAGVEVLHQQMASEDNAYLQRLKRTAFTLGLDLYALSIHQDFVHASAEDRRRHVAHTVRCIELAHELGIPAIRLNSGRWKTIPSFDDLMKAGGVEPAVAGYDDDQAFEWVISSIEACLPHAERLGVVLALESHWGLTGTADGVLRIINAIDSPWLPVCLDTGNLLRRDVPGFVESYDEIAKLAPHAKLVHAKTYFGGGEWYTLHLDYERIAALLRDVNYRGYVSLEFEGKEDPGTGVPRSVELLRRYFG